MILAGCRSASARPCACVYAPLARGKTGHDVRAAGGKLGVTIMRPPNDDVEMRHLAAIVAASDDAIISKDRDAIVRSWNPGAERLYGWTAEEVIGGPISILIPEHRAGEERRVLDLILRGERISH